MLHKRFPAVVKRYFGQHQKVLVTFRFLIKALVICVCSGCENLAHCKVSNYALSFMDIIVNVSESHPGIL